MTYNYYDLTVRDLKEPMTVELYLHKVGVNLIFFKVFKFSNSANH